MKQPRLLPFLFEVLTPFRGWILLQCFISSLWAIDLSLRPYLIKMLLDRMRDLNADLAFQALGPPALLYIGVSALVVISFRFYDLSWLKLNSPLKRHIGLKLMDRMMQHSLNLYQDHFAGNLGNKIKDVMSSVPDLVRISIYWIFNNILALLIAMGTLWSLNAKFAAALSIWVTIFILGTLALSHRARELSDRAAEVRSQMVGTLVDILSNMVSVHLFTGQQRERRILHRILDQHVESDQTRDWFLLKLFAFQGTSFVIYQAICLFWLIAGFKQHWVTAGDFAMVLTINIAIVDCLWSFSREISQFSECVGSISQGLRIVLSKPTVQDQPNAKDLIIDQGEIVFDAVEFHYKNAERLFQNKSVTLSAGQKVGLVGYSGSGKSTFVNLILRLFDVTAGEIRIDGQNIKTVTQNSLRRQIGMIPQDPYLFHRSLLENIRYGYPDAEDEAVFKATKKAHAHQFILTLPYGYQSLVGERGVKLSGGQRQRIAIARTILKNAPILILDEATSQLDSITESEIQESLWQLMEDKTTIVIAHRLSTLLHMDRILVFDQGKIVEDGSHHDLMALKGVYKSLWDSQVSGFLPEQKMVK